MTLPVGRYAFPSGRLVSEPSVYPPAGNCSRPLRDSRHTDYLHLQTVKSTSLGIRNGSVLTLNSPFFGMNFLEFVHLQQNLPV